MSSKITRWSFRRKMRVVLEVGRGELTIQQACTKYELGEYELRDWIFKYRHFGPMSLKTTNMQHHREQFYDQDDDKRGSKDHLVPVR